MCFIPRKVTIICNVTSHDNYMHGYMPSHMNPSNTNTILQALHIDDGNLEMMNMITGEW